jgi:hypothetical protein
VQIIGDGPVLFDTVFATQNGFIHSFIHSFMVVGVGGGGEERLSSATIVDRTVRECWGLGCLQLEECVWEQCGLDTWDQGLPGR